MQTSKGAEPREAASSVTAALRKAMAHPLRAKILVLLTESEASASEMAERFDEDVQNLSYHVRALRDSKPPLIELIRLEAGSRGAPRRIYKAVARPILELDEWERLPQLLREMNSVPVADLIVRDLAAAIRSGTFDARPGRTMLRVPRIVDEQGWRELEPAVMKYLHECDEIQARSLDRLAESKEKGISIFVDTLMFEAAPSSALRPKDK